MNSSGNQSEYFMLLADLQEKNQILFIIHTLVFLWETSATNWTQEAKFHPEFQSLEIN